MIRLFHWKDFQHLFFNGCAHGIWKFSGQGVNLSHSCNLCCSCGNTGSFNPWRWAREPACASAVTQASAVGFFFLSFSRAAPMAHGGSQARVPIGAVATGLHHSHSNIGSELCLQPTPQSPATLDP